MDESAKQLTRDATSTGTNTQTSKWTTSSGSFRTKLERLFPNVYAVDNKKRPSSTPDLRTSSRNKRCNNLPSRKEKTVLLESLSV